MFYIALYVPKKFKEKVKSAIFEAGGGRIGNYSACAWESPGRGQFLGKEDSNPFIGKKGKVKRVKEYKIELVCDDDKIEQVVEALKKAHPYEEPAFHFMKINNL
ncbi:MAG: divalent cation tolerance protein CutA [Spirochaetales bacterium]|nr:divalent cation tolerance protein CutA [Spirochaetales bacterium]